MPTCLSSLSFTPSCSLSHGAKSDVNSNHMHDDMKAGTVALKMVPPNVFEVLEIFETFNKNFHKHSFFAAPTTFESLCCCQATEGTWRNFQVEGFPLVGPISNSKLPLLVHFFFQPHSKDGDVSCGASKWSVVVNGVVCVLRDHHFVF